MEYTIKPSFKLSLNANALKIIAVTAMIVDHSTFWLVPSNSSLYVILRMFGRLAAPIMCYLISEGYFHTSNKKKYFKRLFIFALLSHYPYILYFNLTSLQATSVIWGLFMGLLALSTSQSKVILNLPILRKGPCEPCYFIGFFFLVRFRCYFYENKTHK